MESARRASERSAVVVHGNMKRGLWSLATIASTAPWVGVLGTVQGINDSFLGFDGSKESLMAAIFEGLSRALAPTALGVMHGLETFLQLLAEDRAGWFLPVVSIRDRPPA